MTARSAAGTGRSQLASWRRTQDQDGLVAKEAHDLYCWGFGGLGQLGNEAFRDEVQPYLVLKLRGYGGTLLVSCGFDHTCVVSGDLRARGWGRAQEGQLGVPPEECVESPAGVAAALEPSLPHVCRGEKPVSVQAISAGGMHAALLSLPRTTHDEPRVYTMGRSLEGQLGRDTAPEVAAEAAVTALKLGTEVAEESFRAALKRRETQEKSVAQSHLQLPPKRVPVLVACGGLHSALLTEHGQLYTWGHSGHGQTGQSTREVIAAPRRLPSMAWEGRAAKEARHYTYYGGSTITYSTCCEGGATMLAMRAEHEAPSSSSMHPACSSMHPACSSMHPACSSMHPGASTCDRLGGGGGRQDLQAKGAPRHAAAGLVPGVRLLPHGRMHGRG